MSRVIVVELDRVRIRAREALHPRRLELAFRSMGRVCAYVEYGRFLPFTRLNLGVFRAQCSV